MRIIKIVLSFVAFALALVIAADLAHLITLPDGDGDLIVSLAGFLGILGISPLRLTAQQAKICMGVSGIIVAMAATHSGGNHLSTIPTWLMHAIGILGTLLGVAGATPTLANTPPPVGTLGTTPSAPQPPLKAA
jgi:hypothetical protein